jgi:putative two-component system response regulator
MKKNLPILIADDEKVILMSLKKMINDEFEDVDVFMANDGLKAWNDLQIVKPSILISDITMPTMDGIQLLNKIRNKKEFDRIYIIVLTAKDDKELRKELLEIGADDFISKSDDHSIIIARLRSALRIVRMQEKIKDENEILQNLAKELEGDIQDLTMLAVKFMEARIPASMEMLKNISEASVWIAKEYKDYENATIRDIEIASYLSMAGRIFLPDNLLNEPVMLDGKLTHQLMSQVPVSGKNIVSSLTRFNKVGNYIYHIYENFDGTGIPGQLQTWQIPFPSRIIRVVSDYYELKRTTYKTPEQIISKLKEQSKRLYDHRVVVLLDHYIRSVSKDIDNSNEIAMKISDLQPDMLLTRDVITDSGLKLIPMGIKLSEKSIKMIMNHNSTDPILGGIYVQKHL